MESSNVSISMRDDNNFDCSYAIIQKGDKKIIIVLKDKECAIFDYNQPITECEYHYLLLKHYNSDRIAYKDFLKLIGKMCKKNINSKYFSNHIDEDNRIIFFDFETEHMITDEEKITYEKRYLDFKKYIINTIKLF